MKKKVTFLIMALLIMTVPNLIFAFDPNITDPSPSIDPSLAETSRFFLGAIRWIGYAIAIGMLIYIGIKYMMSSANEKANLKSASINYIIGAIVVAASVTIFDWCIEFFSDAKGGTGANTGTGAGSSSGITNTGVIGGTIGLENMFENDLHTRD